MKQFKPNTAPRVAATITIILALSTLAGWIFDIQFFKGLSGEIFMNPTTAVVLIIAALGLWIKADNGKTVPLANHATTVLGTVIVGIACLKLAAFFGLDFQIDRILFAEELGENQMSPNAAVVFIFSGAALATLNTSVGKKGNLTEHAALAGLFFSFVATVGYLYGAVSLYGAPASTPIALNTTLGCLILNVGIFSVNRKGAWLRLATENDIGGTLARSMVPAVIFVPLTLGWLSLAGINRGLFHTQFAFAVVVVSCIVALFAMLMRVARTLSQNEKDLYAQKQMLEMVLENIADGVVVANPQGRLTLTNSAANRISGIPLIKGGAVEWIRHYKVFKSDGVTPAVLEEFPLTRAMRGLTTDNFETYLKNNDGSPGVYLNSNGRPLFDKEGNILGGVTVFRDITSQKDAQLHLQRTNTELAEKIELRIRELQQSEAQVQQLQKMDAIGRLAGGVAHDFNNMLGAITMYCDLTLDQIEQPEQIKEHIQQINEVAHRGAALTRQLLVFSRKQITHTQTIDMNQLISGINKMLSRLIGDNIQIVTKFQENLGPVKIDPAQMEQVIMNLVVNARDAMPTGGKITIETSSVYLDEEFTSTHLTVVPGSYALISVSDTGAGMDTVTQSRIFEPFFTTKPVGKGTGLGLTTAYGIVKQSKGTIWVYSEAGRGTMFKIYLPISAAEPQVLEPNTVEKAETQQMESRTILLVEDDDRLRVGYSDVLKRTGFHVLTAANGIEALEVCNNTKEEIHLLLTDVMMPEMGGFELAKRVRELRGNARVIFMSGYTDDTVTQEGFDQKIILLQKPFSVSGLIAKIHEVLLVKS